MGHDRSADRGHTESPDAKINELCSRFERHWQANERLSIEACLQQCPAHLREALLRELLLTELELRRRAGETATEAEYRARFPNDTQIVDDVLDVHVEHLGAALRLVRVELCAQGDAF